MKARCANCYRAKVIFRILRQKGNDFYAGAWQEIRHRHTKTKWCSPEQAKLHKGLKGLRARDPESNLTYQTASISPGEDSIVLYLGEGEIHRASDRGKGLIS